MLRKCVLVASVILPFFFTSAGSAQEPGWASDVFVPRATQRRVDAVPIVARPYRPFHVYGNTVRRIHYRGRALPTFGDIRNARRHLMRRPYVPVERYLR